MNTLWGLCLVWTYLVDQSLLNAKVAVMVACNTLKITAVVAPGDGCK
jgi:hypothetical protein